MSPDEIYEKLTPIFQEVFEDDELVAAPEVTAEASEGWDSMGHIRMILAVEQAFGVKFNTSEIAGFENVGELVQMIGKKLN